MSYKYGILIGADTARAGRTETLAPPAETGYPDRAGGEGDCGADMDMHESAAEPEGGLGGMPGTIFDTMRGLKRLEEGGLDRPAAEAIVLFAEEATANLATKEQVNRVRTEISGKIDTTAKDIRGEIKALDTKIDTTAESLRGETKALGAETKELRAEIREIRGDITEVRGDITEIRSDIKALDSRIELVTLRLKFWLATIVFGAVGSVRLLEWLLA